MIGINMELPKDCESCRFNEYGCIFLERIDIDEYEKTKNVRRKDCPLVDLGKEDMSWEELVESFKKSKEVNVDTIKNRIYLSKFNISFKKNGEIYLCFGTSQIYITRKEKITPYQMYQIIKSLVGDER